jgi:hypothetical protein
MTILRGRPSFFQLTCRRRDSETLCHMSETCFVCVPRSFIRIWYRQEPNSTVFHFSMRNAGLLITQENSQSLGPSALVRKKRRIYRSRTRTRRLTTESVHRYRVKFAQFIVCQNAQIMSEQRKIYMPA